MGFVVRSEGEQIQELLRAIEGDGLDTIAGLSYRTAAYLTGADRPIA